MLKRILLVLLLTMSINANSYDQPNESFFMQKDKILHMGVSAFVGIAGTALCHQEFGLTAGQSWWCGMGAALIVGAAKEFNDTNFDNMDLLADGIGGAIGSSFLYYQYKF